MKMVDQWFTRPHQPSSGTAFGLSLTLDPAVRLTRPGSRGERRE